MKIATAIIRILMGLMFIFASAAYFLELFPQPALTGPLKSFMDGVTATGYLMTFIKAVELLCGLLFITGRYVAFANVAIFPIIINIVLVHSFIAPEGMPTAILLLIGNLFLFYAYRKHYALVFASRRIE